MPATAPLATGTSLSNAGCVTFAPFDPLAIMDTYTSRIVRDISKEVADEITAAQAALGATNFELTSR